MLEKTLLNLNNYYPFFLNWIVNIVAAMLIFILGYTAAKFFSRRVNGARLGKHQLDPTLKPVIGSLVFYMIFAMTLYAVLVKLGVPATSLIAVFGAAGLAIGLSLKDTLSNIAAGFMLLALRPLQVGEFVDFNNSQGTVTEIGLFATTVKSSEGLFIYVPNRNVWSGRIQNFGRHQIRKAVIEIGVSYAADLKATQTLMLETMTAQRDVLTDPSPPECYVMNFGESGVTLSMRCWLPADNWLARSSELRIALKSTLDENGVDIPYPQRVVHTKNS